MPSGGGPVTDVVTVQPGAYAHTGFAITVAGVAYATIVDGRVTALGIGPLPASDETHLYLDISDYDPQPARDDYFSEICQTFSTIPPVTPPGDVAPPYPPGSTPPVIGDPGYPGGPVEPGPPAIAPTLPVLIVFEGASTDVATVSATPAALTEVTAKWRTSYDLNGACAVRVQGNVVAPVAGAVLVAQYSDDNGTTWYPLSPAGSGPRMDCSASGDVQGAFTNIAAGAQDLVLLSLFTESGDDATDLELGNVSLLVYAKLGSGNCVELVETVPDGGCDVVAGHVVEDFSADDADLAALDTRWSGTPGAVFMVDPYTSPNWTLNRTARFNGNPTLDALVGTDVGPRLGGVAEGAPVDPGSPFGDAMGPWYWSFVANIGSGVGDSTPGYAPDGGMLLFLMTEYDSDTFSVNMRNGSLFVLMYTATIGAGTTTRYDIGAAADFQGANVEWIIGLDWRNISSGVLPVVRALSTATISLWARDACSEAVPTLLWSGTTSAYDHRPSEIYYGYNIGSAAPATISWKMFANDGDKTLWAIP